MSKVEHVVPESGTLNEISYCSRCGASYTDKGPCPGQTFRFEPRGTQERTPLWSWIPHGSGGCETQPYMTRREAQKFAKLNNGRAVFDDQ